MDYVVVLYKVDHFHLSGIQIDKICEAYYEGYNNSKVILLGIESARCSRKMTLGNILLEYTFSFDIDGSLQ